MATFDQFESVLKLAGKLGVSNEQLNTLESVEIIKNVGTKWFKRNVHILIAGFICLAVVVPPSYLVYIIKHKTEEGSMFLQEWSDASRKGPLRDLKCLVEFGPYEPYVRKPVDCKTCAGITEVKHVRNLTQKDFLHDYAFTMQPVVVEDGQLNWTARETFSYDYFKGIYTPGSKAFEQVSTKCQFFPYDTNMNGLREFFTMSKDRVEGKEDRWYIGWSNCEGPAANELRKHYHLPYFLPPELDHSKVDWVFMGMPGYGAPMHVDFVTTSSWQAQLRGIKKWTFETPPECYGICPTTLEVKVKPGEIIVFDGNSWYHQTEIIGNETSIVIGSEYF
uniref:JmjC domain-containing protein n=1 Tax=Ciona savignyi TaxID=51511 RepID=H2ZER0_CIOSA